MIDAPSSERYWQVVIDCLVELHGESPRHAQSLVDDLLRRWSAIAPPKFADLIYHEEQFDLANGLAGHDLDRKQYNAAYNLIVERHYASVMAER